VTVRPIAKPCGQLGSAWTDLRKPEKIQSTETKNESLLSSTNCKNETVPHEQVKEMIRNGKNNLD
jgi:hypothetical protein